VILGSRNVLESLSSLHVWLNDLPGLVGYGDEERCVTTYFVAQERFDIANAVALDIFE